MAAGDFRFIRAFPVLNHGSETDRRYRVNAERILVQSIAASTMLAHLAAAALGYISTIRRGSAAAAPSFSWKKFPHLRPSGKFVRSVEEKTIRRGGPFTLPVTEAGAPTSTR